MVKPADRFRRRRRRTRCAALRKKSGQRPAAAVGVPLGPPHLRPGDRRRGRARPWPPPRAWTRRLRGELKTGADREARRAGRAAAGGARQGGRHRGGDVRSRRLSGTMAGSRPWPMAPARAGCSSRTRSSHGTAEAVAMARMGHDDRQATASWSTAWSASTASPRWSRAAGGSASRRWWSSATARAGSATAAARRARCRRRCARRPSRPSAA